MFDKSVVSETVNIGPDEEHITINELYQKIPNKLKFNQKLNIMKGQMKFAKHFVLQIKQNTKLQNL